MDIGAQEIVNKIVESTGQYLVTYLPIFLLISGLVLALVVIERIISIFFPQKENDDTILDSK